MKIFKKIFFLIFMMLLFSGCSQKIDNISKKESYKVLDEVAVVALQTNIDIINGSSSYNFSHFVNWKNGAGVVPVFTPNHSAKSSSCFESKIYPNKIINNLSKFKDLLTKEQVKINTIYEPTKKLLVVTPIKFDCTNDDLYVKVTLYDIEDMSKTWNKKNVQKTLEEIKDLEDKNIIYQNIFIADKCMYFTDEDIRATKSFEEVDLEKVENRIEENINKLYENIIKELKKAMKI